MYLLDPDEGADRRSVVRSMAGSVASSTGSALESGWNSLRETAARVYHAAGEGAGAFKEKLSEGASAVGEKLSEGADYVTDNRYARRLSKSARRAKEEAADRFGYLLHGRRRHGLESGLSQGLAAVACLGLGVGAMYFLDPRDGARRRQVFRDKLLSAFGRMAGQLERQGRNIWNRASGMVYEARSDLSREQVDDRTLTERIRSTIGRYVDNAGAIEVTVIDGRATLRGPIMASQLNRLLKGVRGIRGVNSIDNQMDVSSQAGSVGRGNSFTRGGIRQASSRSMT
jgi:hypothetical protein